MSLAIGIDVGASTIKGALLSDGQVLTESTGRTFGQTEFKESFATLTQVIDTLWQPEVQKIGIVTTGDVDAKAGVVTYAINLPGWTNAPLKALLEKRYAVPVYLENDAVGALLAEASLLPRCKKITMLTFGTGLGSANLSDGKLVKDPRYAWANRKLHPEDTFTAEQVLSATALKRDAKRTYGKTIFTLDLFRRCRKGESRADAVFQRFSDSLVALFAIIEQDFAPDAIVLGGGIMNGKDVIETYLKGCPYPYRFAFYGNLAGAIGATMLPIDSREWNKGEEI